MRWIRENDYEKVMRTEVEPYVSSRRECGFDVFLSDCRKNSLDISDNLHYYIIIITRIYDKIYLFLKFSV